MRDEKERHHRPFPVNHSEVCSEWMLSTPSSSISKLMQIPAIHPQIIKPISKTKALTMAHLLHMGGAARRTVPRSHRRLAANTHTNDPEN
jgi:hypothetical protein